MNIWAPDTRADFRRFRDHNEEHGLDAASRLHLAEWLHQQGENLTYKSGRTSRHLRDDERLVHRNYNKRRQYVIIFRRASDDPHDDSVEIPMLYSSNEQWDITVQDRTR